MSRVESLALEQRALSYSGLTHLTEEVGTEVGCMVSNLTRVSLAERCKSPFVSLHICVLPRKSLNVPKMGRSVLEYVEGFQIC